MKILIVVLIIILLYSGCSRNIPSNEQRLKNLRSLKKKQSIEKIYNTQSFNLFSIQTTLKECNNIKIYIEGDGLSWITKFIVSSNSTPLNPIAFKLMNLDKSKCKIYLARPCQYTTADMCEKKYWTSHRFNIKVIDSYQEALNQIKDINKNTTFTLIGYSGGDAVSSLLASKRDDIKKLITIAGNLDHQKWTNIQNITPLSGSLNPINFTKQLETIPQYHLIGRNDRVIPKDIFNSYQSNFINKQNINYKLYDSTHSKGWEQSYRQFLKEKNGSYAK